jgi:hypothetical protein
MLSFCLLHIPTLDTLIQLIQLLLLVNIFGVMLDYDLRTSLKAPPNILSIACPSSTIYKLVYINSIKKGVLSWHNSIFVSTFPPPLDP